ncbi:MAG: hypothetical protein ABIH21_01605 [Patescibacteria group bacterium]
MIKLIPIAHAHASRFAKKLDDPAIARELNKLGILAPSDTSHDDDPDLIKKELHVYIRTPSKYGSRTKFPCVIKLALSNQKDPVEITQWIKRSLDGHAKENRSSLSF